MNQTTAWKEPDPSLITVTQVTYALHALGLAIGIPHPDQHSFSGAQATNQGANS